jgi:hypothetical protein
MQYFLPEFHQTIHRVISQQEFGSSLLAGAMLSGIPFSGGAKHLASRPAALWPSIVTIR